MDRDALLQHIITNPDDNDARRVFADLEEERGDLERAELIRLQLGRYEGDEGEEDAELQTRERTLLRKNASRWAGPLRGLVREFVFARGFIERVCMPLQDVQLDSVLGAAPILHLRDIHHVSDLNALLSLGSRLERLRGLELWGLHFVPPEEYRALWQCPHLQGLQTLVLQHDTNSDFPKQDLLAEMLQDHHHRSLQNLVVGTDNTFRGLGKTAALALCQRGFPELHRLKLSCARLSERAAARLLAACPKVVELDLSRASASLAAWRALLDSPGLGRLVQLQLSDARVDNSALMGTPVAEAFEQRLGPRVVRWTPDEEPVRWDDEVWYGW